MADSDPDSISLTSTTISQDRPCYNVERILAEWDSGEFGIYYLVEWEGYPLERTTWEPKASFLQEDSLQQWQETKLRIVEGQELPFDYQDLEDRKAQIEDEKRERKVRRNKKRARLGLFQARRTGQWTAEQAITSSEGELGDAASVDASSSEAEPLSVATPGKRHSSSTAVPLDLEVSHVPDDPPASRRLAKKARTESHGDVSMKDVTSLEQRGNGTKQDPAPISTYKGTMGYSNTIKRQQPPKSLQRNMDLGKKTKTKSSANPQQIKKPLLNPSKASLKNGEARLSGLGVVKDGKKPPSQRRKTFDEGPAKGFRNLSIQRKVQQARQREPTPDLQALTFVNLEDGKAMSKEMPAPNPEQQQKTPFQMIQDQMKSKGSDMADRRPAGADLRRSPSPMDIDMNRHEPPLFIEEAQSRPPEISNELSNRIHGGIEVVSASETSGDKGATILSIPDPAANQGEIEIEMKDTEPNYNTTTNMQNQSSTIVTPANVERLQNKQLQISPSETVGNSRGEKGPASETSPVNMTRQQQFYSRESHQPALSEEVRRRDSAPHSTVSRPTFQLHQTMQAERAPKIPENMRDFVKPKAFSYIIGDHGMGKPDPRWSTYSKTKEDKSDLFAELLATGVKKEESKVILRGLDFPIMKLIMLLKDGKGLPIRIHSQCSFNDYSQQYHGTDVKYFGAGHILQSSWSKSAKKIESELRGSGKAGLCFAEYFTIVIYPTGHDDWATFDQRYPNDSPWYPLRFLVRESYEAQSRKLSEASIPAYGTTVRMQETYSYTDAEPHSEMQDFAGKPSQIDFTAYRAFPEQERLQSSHRRQMGPTRDPRLKRMEVSSPPELSAAANKVDLSSKSHLEDQLQVLRQVMKQNPDWATSLEPLEELSQAIQASELPTVIRLFKEYFGIDWNDMVPRSTKPEENQKETSVYLCYPESAGAERKILVAFLGRVGVKRYDSSSSADWQAFTKIRQAGVILIHDSVKHFQPLSRLGSLLNNSPGINVFRISLGLPFPKPGGKEFVHIDPGCVRLFPSGSGILMTDSVLLQKPDFVNRFLIWFREFVLVKKPPFTWQFFTRPRFPTWLEMLVEDNAGSPAHAPRIYLHVFREFNNLVRVKDLEADRDTPKSKAPFHSEIVIPGYDLGGGLASKRLNGEVLAKNDDILMRWFGNVTLDQVEKKRKFTVIYDGPQGPIAKWKKEWPHLRVVNSDDYYKAEIAPWEHSKRKHQKRAKANESPQMVVTNR